MEEGYFDNCPICQAQKVADKEERELTLEEYIIAVEEAKKHGGASGVIYL